MGLKSKWFDIPDIAPNQWQPNADEEPGVTASWGARGPSFMSPEISINGEIQPQDTSEGANPNDRAANKILPQYMQSLFQGATLAGIDPAKLEWAAMVPGVDYNTAPDALKKQYWDRISEIAKQVEPAMDNNPNIHKTGSAGFGELYNGFIKPVSMLSGVGGLLNAATSATSLADFLTPKNLLNAGKLVPGPIGQVSNLASLGTGLADGSLLDKAKSLFADSGTIAGDAYMPGRLSGFSDDALNGTTAAVGDGNYTLDQQTALNNVTIDGLTQAQRDALGIDRFGTNADLNLDNVMTTQNLTDIINLANSGTANTSLNELLKGRGINTGGNTLDLAAAGKAAAAAAAAQTALDTGNVDEFGNPIDNSGGTQATQADINKQTMSSFDATKAAADAARTAAGAAGAGAALSRIIDGTATTQDRLSTLAGAGAVGASVLAGNNTADSLEKMYQNNLAIGKPSRDRYEASYAPGFDLSASDPAYKGALDQTMNAYLRKASTGGNPFSNPGVSMEANKYVAQNTALPWLQNYRTQNASSGGMSAFSTAAPASGVAAAGSQDMGLTNLFGGLSQLVNPAQTQNQSLTDMFNRWKVGNFSGGPG